MDALGMTSDRHGITVLNAHECWDLLRQTEVGRLAVSIHDEPEVFPINFIVDRGTVVFRTAQGTKLVGAIEGRAVAFEADGYQPDVGEAWSVIIKGRATEIERNYDLFEVMHLPLFPGHAAPKHHFVRIDPLVVSGRRFHVTDKSNWEILPRTPHARPE
jgi:hypothetical protein